MRVGEIDQEAAQGLLRVLVDIASRLKLARQARMKSIAVDVGGKLHRSIQRAIDRATNPPPMDSRD